MSFLRLFAKRRTTKAPDTTEPYCKMFLNIAAIKITPIKNENKYDCFNEIKGISLIKLENTGIFWIESKNKRVSLIKNLKIGDTSLACNTVFSSISFLSLFKPTILIYRVYLAF